MGCQMRTTIGPLLIITMFIFKKKIKIKSWHKSKRIMYEAQFNSIKINHFPNDDSRFTTTKSTKIH